MLKEFQLRLLCVPGHTSGAMFAHNFGMTKQGFNKGYKKWLEEQPKHGTAKEDICKTSRAWIENLKEVSAKVEESRKCLENKRSFSSYIFLPLSLICAVS